MDEGLALRVVICDNLRSAWNVGSVFRTASALAYDEVALCGVTMTPPSSKLNETSRGTEHLVPWRSFSRTSLAFEYYRNQGFSLVALESGVESQNPSDWQGGSRVAWIIGNEAKGIASELLLKVDRVLELPIKGDQASINVACAFSAMAYWDEMAFKNQD